MMSKNPILLIGKLTIKLRKSATYQLFESSVLAKNESSLSILSFFLIFLPALSFQYALLPYTIQMEHLQQCSVFQPNTESHTKKCLNNGYINRICCEHRFRNSQIDISKDEIINKHICPKYVAQTETKQYQFFFSNEKYYNRLIDQDHLQIMLR